MIDVPTNEIPERVLGEIELASKGNAKPLACYDKTNRSRHLENVEMVAVCFYSYAKI